MKKLKTKLLLSSAILATPISIFASSGCATPTTPIEKTYTVGAVQFEDVVFSSSTVKEGEDLDITVSLIHIDVFLEGDPIITVGSKTITDYTFETLSNNQYHLFISNVYIDDNVLLYFELKRSTINDFEFHFEDSGEVKDSLKIDEAELPEEIHYDQGATINLHLIDNDPSITQFIFSSTQIEVKIHGNQWTGTKTLKEHRDYDFITESLMPTRAHFILHSISSLFDPDFDCRYICFNLKVVDRKSKCTIRVTDGVQTYPAIEIPSSGDFKYELNDILIDPNKQVNEIVVWKYQDTEMPPEWKIVDDSQYQFNKETSELTLPHGVIEGAQIYIELKMHCVDDTTFENDSWENIIYWARAPKDYFHNVYNIQPNDNLIGHTRIVKYDGIEQEVRVIGEEHDNISGTTDEKALLTFEFSKCLYDADGTITKKLGKEKHPDKKFWCYKKDGIEEKEMNPVRSFLHDEFLTKLEAIIVNNAIPIEKNRITYFRWDSDPQIQYNNITDTFFLLSATEMGGRTKNIEKWYPYFIETNLSQYEYYQNTDIGDGSWDKREKKNYEDKPVQYWLSTPSREISKYIDNEYLDQCLGVDTDGSFFSKVEAERAFAPCFCI